MYDKVSIAVQGGNGGAGAISFRREKFVPFGGPDGGDGGGGGDVIIKADPAVTHFKEFRHKGLYRAKSGESGKGEQKYGKRGEDLVVKVPVGTIVYEDSSEGEKNLLADLSTVGEQVMVARGGRGGWGNIHYATSTNQTPRLAQVGEGGEKKLLVLELRLIADIGIIGYPNVGKSSLLTAASAAKPKIADYPFTTKEPELGVVEIRHNTFVLAEIPGLIEGAHQGRGLGYDFLRHSARTKIFIHLVDGSAESPVENMIKVNNELSLYDPALGMKPQIVVVNKVDLPEVRDKREQIVADFATIGVTVRFISAATGEGVQELMRTAFEIVRKMAVSQEAVAPKIFRPQPRRRSTEVSKDGDIFVINSPDIERIILRVAMDDPTVRWQVYGFLLRKGIGKELEKAGIKGGDKVRCGNTEWDW
jgi:GTP-binding protein